jgi:hypothetical protein
MDTNLTKSRNYARDNVKLSLKRYNFLDDRTIGKLYVNGTFFGYTLEDARRDVKIKGETCIPAGKYKIGFREELSPLTKKYRQMFPWFVWHLEIKNVPDFKYIYIHIGNYPKDTNGCILVGKELAEDKRDNKPIIRLSKLAFEELYKYIYNEIRHGSTVEIEIV